MLKLFRVLSPGVKRRTPGVLGRGLADAPPADSTTKTIAIHGAENEQRVRVRRVRPSDVPRLLRFVRENSRAAWPNLHATAAAPNSASQLVLADYVCRALSQGHSMIAEELGSRRGLLTVRGVALGAALCPWDASVLERWARCLRCARSRRLVNFTAHCMRAPELHDKYHVHRILQVMLIVPPDALVNSEIVQMLATGAIQRGKDAGFSLLRFDITNEKVAKALESLKLKKEWHLSYDVVPSMTEGGATEAPAAAPAHENNFLTVYSTLTADHDLPKATPKP